MGSDFELKINPTRDDDPSSTFELQLAKGTATPFFCSNETNSMFILTAKLTGFAADDIVITINGSGTRIEIGWGKLVRKVEITGRMYKKETETRRFKKIFRIPDGVVLDEIKATYNDKESVLKISMPKLVHGMLGVRIEEVKEQEAGEATFGSQDYQEELLETLETGRKTNLVDDNHEKEDDDAANGEVEEKNVGPEAFHEREYVAEMPPEEIKKLKGNEMDQDIDGESNDDYSERKQTVKVATKTTEYEATRENVNGEIKVPRVRSKEGIDVAEGTANHQKEKRLDAGACDGDKATLINKTPYVKTRSKASMDREAQVLDHELSQPNRLTQAEPGTQETYKNIWELKELETDKGSPYLQSPAHQHEGKGVDQKGSSQTKDEIKDAREECKSTHEDSSKEAKQEKKQDSKQFKVRTPIIIAGSALLASLAIVVFNLMKSKRREKNMRG